jgi:hypothetical protein
MERSKKANAGVGATLWALLIVVCLGLVVAHLVDAVRNQLVPQDDLIEHTFTVAARGDLVPMIWRHTDA